jgi:nitric oxide dioxygenase
VDALAQKYSTLKIHYRYSDPAKPGVERTGNASTGFIDAELIESFVPGRDADYYFCGPQPFMVGIYHELLKWGMPPAQVHFEFFGPRQALERQAA